MEKIFGNRMVLDTFESMLKNNRVAHAFLIFGAKGLGKKSIATYMASRIAETAHPFSHPDIIFAQHSGKTNGFSVADLRKICSDAYIIPNTSERKVYVFNDCDNISTAAQDTLLKIVEEPPPYAHFIFTASDKSIFLPTIISRVISLGVSECSYEECKEALSGDYSIEDINEAYSVFSGNIGLMKEYLIGGSLKTAVSVTKDITESIISGNEYDMLKSLSGLDNDREMAKTVLSMVDKVIRDCSVMKISEVGPISCYSKGAKKLSDSISVKKAGIIHGITEKTLKELDTNVNLSIMLSSYCAQLISIR